MLAKAVSSSDDVVDAFYDGILWVTLGTQPNVVEVIADLCRALGSDARFSGLDASRGNLRSLLETRRCLLVIDDVWRVTDLEPLIALGSSVATLVPPDSRNRSLSRLWCRGSCSNPGRRDDG